MNWGIEIDICARAYLAQSCLIFATPWIVTHQNLLSIDLSRHKYCSGLLFLTSEDLLNQGIEAPSLVFLYQQGDFLSLCHLESPYMCMHYHACTKTASESMLHGMKSSGWCSVMSQVDGTARSGREVPEGGNIRIYTADSLHCTAKKNTTLSLRNKKQKLTTGTLNHPLAPSKLRVSRNFVN